MALPYPIFDTDPGYEGPPNYTPIDPTAPPQPPISTAPAAPAAPAGVAPGTVLPPTPRPVPRRAPTNLPIPVVDGIPRYAAADYGGAALGLMPRGRLWPQQPGTVQEAVRLAIGKTFERSDGDANMLLETSLPGSLTPLLPEWEATLGLPDPCAGTAPTFAQRCDQVRGRFVNAGGQSRQHFIDFAAALGFMISITNYAPFRVGISTVGNPVADDDVAFVWGVTIDAVTGDLPIAVLKCELEAIQPAEGTLIFLNA